MRKFLKALNIKLTYELITHAQDYTEKIWKQGLNIPHNDSKVQATKAARLDERQTRCTTGIQWSSIQRKCLKTGSGYVDLADLELTMQPKLKVNVRQFSGLRSLAYTSLMYNMDEP